MNPNDPGAQDIFYQKELSKYLNDQGEIAPPWVFSAMSHPYSIQWRMGAGESYLMIYTTWFEKQFETEAARVGFFKRYPPPPRWLGWVADSIWDLEPMEEDFDYTPYLEQLASLGFAGTALYQTDLDDEQWT